MQQLYHVLIQGNQENCEYFLNKNMNMIERLSVSPFQNQLLQEAFQNSYWLLYDDFQGACLQKFCD